MFPKWGASGSPENVANTTPSAENDAPASRRWRFGILSDRYTDEVPGSVILLPSAHRINEPPRFQHCHAHTSTSSLPSPSGPPERGSSRSSRQSSSSHCKEEKRTRDGRFILVPQPEESPNDPLNWPRRRRDVALLSLGFYCMVGGGMTPLLAAGFKNVAQTYRVSVPKVALTTGLYMLGLGMGSVVASPTAILWGKRPVYLTAIILFFLSSLWCALSPNYPSLVVARIVQGISVSPVECLPSATVAEIFFLHERAYRLGIYTLLLLGGKNIIPLVSAAIVQSLGWRWVFWIFAVVVAFCFVLIFFFVPETSWDRSSMPRNNRSYTPRNRCGSFQIHRHEKQPGPLENENKERANPETHGGNDDTSSGVVRQLSIPTPIPTEAPDAQFDIEKQADATPNMEMPTSRERVRRNKNSESAEFRYTDFYRSAPRKSYIQSLKPWNGRLVDDNWLRVMVRPFILFAYPAVLWSSMVYAFAIGWLIVLSESVSDVYRNRDSYNFTALQVGLVYISPFVGGILGTAVAGKISDIVVRFMARKNNGVYEPEYRLVMAVPIALSTTIGLMGFGWSAEERDSWIVPTVFFGVISFGCSLASTTAVTFVVDSYRAYAGEALVTLNFSKNILHGFVFSLFFPHWLEASGSKDVFLAIGGIQMGCMLFSIPMYIFGKRARMWTYKKNLMGKF